MSLPAGTYGRFDIAFRDASGEVGRATFYGKVITAANHDAQLTAANAVVTAMTTLSNGILAEWRYDAEHINSPLSPAQGARELYLKVHFWDATNFQKFTTNVPVINESLLTYIPGAGDNIDLTTTAVAAFITAFEGFAVPPVNPGHTVQVYKLTVAGKNT